jgi:phosphatidylserine decarboxylase
VRHHPIAPDGYLYLAVGLAVTLACLFLWPWLALLPAAITLFIAFFFRNPQRTGPVLPDALLSPADGKVMRITPSAGAETRSAASVRITIFLSLFNVHINRAPMSGSITACVYRPGRFLPAFKSHASDLNECNTLTLEHAGRVVLVRQITGFLARRIVCDVKPGDRLEQRQRFGMIRFGSCTELVCPADVTIQIKPGDTVRAGQTVLAIFKQEHEVSHVS